MCFVVPCFEPCFEPSSSAAGVSGFAGLAATDLSRDFSFRVAGDDQPSSSATFANTSSLAAYVSFGDLKKGMMSGVAAQTAERVSVSSEETPTHARQKEPRNRVVVRFGRLFLFVSSSNNYNTRLETAVARRPAVQRTSLRRQRQPRRTCQKLTVSSASESSTVGVHPSQRRPRARSIKSHEKII